MLPLCPRILQEIRSYSKKPAQLYGQDNGEQFSSIYHFGVDVEAAYQAAHLLGSDRSPLLEPLVESP